MPRSRRCRCGGAGWDGCTPSRARAVASERFSSPPLDHVELAARVDAECGERRVIADAVLLDAVSRTLALSEKAPELPLGIQAMVARDMSLNNREPMLPEHKEALDGQSPGAVPELVERSLVDRPFAG